MSARPKPLALAARDGDTNKIGARKLREKIAAEPKAAGGLPECPHHLKGRARSVWNFWREQLEEMGLDHKPDAQMLEGACVVYARAVKADLIVEREGIMQETFAVDEETGNPVLLKSRAHPAIHVSDASWRQVRAFCSEFGLSPASRVRLAVPKEQDRGEDLSTLLMQPRPTSRRASVQ